MWGKKALKENIFKASREKKIKAAWILTQFRINLKKKKKKNVQMYKNVQNVQINMKLFFSSFSY